MNYKKEETINSRVPNFEILRSVAMLFIVVWYFCVHGITENSNVHQFDLSIPIGVFNCIVTNIVCCITGISVNVFILITGYFMISKSYFSIKKIEDIYFHGIFYSLVFVFVGLGLNQNIDMFKYIAKLFYMNEEYWFVNKYLGLMFIAPFCTLLAKQMTHKEYLALLLSLAVINITFFAPFFTIFGEANGGYSLQWFVFIFLVGGYIRKYDITKSEKTARQFFFLVFIVHLLTIFFLRWKNGELAVPIAGIPYNSFLFFEAVFFFLIFKNHTFSSNIWIPFIKFAPYTFGVYLIHCNHVLSPLLWIGPYSPSQLINSIWLIPCLMFESCLIFIFSITIDCLRHLLVKNARLNELLIPINMKLDAIYKYIISMIINRQ